MAEHDPADPEEDVVDRLTTLVHAIRPCPDLPLDEEFRIGLGPVLTSFLTLGGDARPGGLTGRALGLVDTVFSIAVGPEGVAARRAIRTRDLGWDEVGAVVLQGRDDFIATRVVGGLAHDVVGTAVRIPGLRGLLQKVARALAERSASLVTRDEADQPPVVAAVRARDGKPVEFTGVLGLMVVTACGFTEACIDEADRREIPVIRPGS